MASPRPSSWTLDPIKNKPSSGTQGRKAGDAKVWGYDAWRQPLASPQSPSPKSIKAQLTPRTLVRRKGRASPALKASTSPGAWARDPPKRAESAPPVVEEDYFAFLSRPPPLDVEVEETPLSPLPSTRRARWQTSTKATYVTPRERKVKTPKRRPTDIDRSCYICGTLGHYAATCPDGLGAPQRINPSRLAAKVPALAPVKDHFRGHAKAELGNDFHTRGAVNLFTGTTTFGRAPLRDELVERRRQEAARRREEAAAKAARRRELEEEHARAVEDAKRMLAEPSPAKVSLHHKLTTGSNNILG